MINPKAWKKARRNRSIEEHNKLWSRGAIRYFGSKMPKPIASDDYSNKFSTFNGKRNGYKIIKGKVQYKLY